MMIESDRRISPHSETGVDIAFVDVKYEVEVEAQQTDSLCPCNKQYSTKTILKGVSGIMKAGEATAIMGASGAGKTTLLNILSCRIPCKQDEVGFPSGRLWANSLQYNYKDFNNFGNYVMQNDILLQTLTVRETLEYVAKLKVNEPETIRNRKI